MSACAATGVACQISSDNTGCPSGPSGTSMLNITRDLLPVLCCPHPTTPRERLRLHDVGLPITPPVEAVVDKGPDKGRRILVQAFQRTILTYDPSNPADYVIERANVGTDYARAFPHKFGG